MSNTKRLDNKEICLADLDHVAGGDASLDLKAYAKVDAKGHVTGGASIGIHITLHDKEPEAKPGTEE